jgi:hypothetical protein
LDFKPSNGEIEVGGMQRGLDTNIFCGEYVATETSHDGGGEASDMNGHPEYWPNGHHIYAKKIIDRFGKKELSNFEINFYQSGCFTCMNPEIKAIRKQNLTVVLA